MKLADFGLAGGKAEGESDLEGLALDGFHPRPSTGRKDAMVCDPNSPARAQCPYCGVGCGLELKPPADPAAAGLWTARGDRQHPSSLGQVCVKGATVGETLHHNRLTTPLWRERTDQPLAAISWERAFSILVERIEATLASKGPQALAIYGSGQFLCEDYYAANKLLKGALGSNNFDANSRLCMSSAVAGYARSLGSDGPPCCYDDLDLADLVLLIGTNTAECHPVLFQRLLKRRRKGKGPRLVVVDPRATATSDASDLHLAIAPGSDLALLCGLGHLLLQRGGVDQAFVAAHTEGFAELEVLWRAWEPARAAAVCGIAVADLEQLAAWWCEASATVAGICNLHLVSGQIGKPGAGPFSLTGQPNAMGGREVGGLARLLPGYRVVSDPLHRAELELQWGLAPGSIAPEPGLVEGGEAKVRSRRGALRVKLLLTERIRPGTVFLPMHWGASQGELACEANRLMHELGCSVPRCLPADPPSGGGPPVAAGLGAAPGPALAAGLAAEQPALAGGIQQHVHRPLLAVDVGVAGDPFRQQREFTLAAVAEHNQGSHGGMGGWRG